MSFRVINTTDNKTLIKMVLDFVKDESVKRDNGHKPGGSDL